MTISINPVGFRSILDQAPPNQLPDAFRAMLLGLTIRSMKTFLRNKSPNTAAASPFQLATLQTLTLPDDAKANTILRAYARTGTGTKGELTVSSYGTTPTATHVAVAPNGDIVFLATDAYTSVDVVYEPERLDVLELTLPVVPGTGVCALPSKVTAQGVVILMEAQALAGTVTGNDVVLVPGGTPGSTLQANLNLAKTQVQFLVADAVSSARVKLGLVPAVDIDALLQGTSPVV